ncbi:unnamed protein product [Euphydryas editha]|uniref:Uncharacterized protein n=1 Tax=Euphydryas editha TaxID=104508 RepID=A0AAU9URL9_EUPED|nr:unnamed protein product [Euphydryas editha]
MDKFEMVILPFLHSSFDIIPHSSQVVGVMELPYDQATETTGISGISAEKLTPPVTTRKHRKTIKPILHLTSPQSKISILEKDVKKRLKTDNKAVEKEKKKTNDNENLKKKNKREYNIRIGEWRSVGCFAHSLNLCVQNAIKSIADVLAKNRIYYIPIPAFLILGLKKGDLGPQKPLNVDATDAQMTRPSNVTAAGIRELDKYVEEDYLNRKIL